MPDDDTPTTDADPAVPVKEVDPVMMPMRDQLTMRVVVFALVGVLLMLTATACALWLNRRPTPEILDRWWGQALAYAAGVLTTTSVHVAAKARSKKKES